MNYEELYEYVKTFDFYEDDETLHFWKHHSVFDNNDVYYEGTKLDIEIFRRLLPFYSDDKIIIEEEILDQCPEYTRDGIKYFYGSILVKTNSLKSKNQFLLDNLSEHKELIIDDQRTFIEFDKEESLGNSFNSCIVRELRDDGEFKDFDNEIFRMYQIRYRTPKDEVFSGSQFTVIGTEREIELYSLIKKSSPHIKDFEASPRKIDIVLSYEDFYFSAIAMPYLFKHLKKPGFKILHDDWYFELIK